MNFTAPMPLADALRIAAERELLPTSMGSGELRDTFAPAIRRQSLFSARTANAAYLQKVKDLVASYTAGEIDRPQARLILRQMLDELGYTPEGGFEKAETEIPPAEEGSLQDLRSEPRLDLILKTNARMALNRGYVEQWADEDQRFAFPAWELVRIYPREVPRGMKRTKAGLVDDPGQDWPSRWQDAGGRFSLDGRMIARVDDPIWTTLGDSRLFDDGLDNPYPPFAFNSGYGLRAVDRREAIAAGVIREGDTPGAPDGAASPEIAPAPKAEKLGSRFDKDILEQLRASLDRDLKDWDSGATLHRELERAAGGAR